MTAAASEAEKVPHSINVQKTKSNVEAKIFFISIKHKITCVDFSHELSENNQTRNVWALCVFVCLFVIEIQQNMTHISHYLTSLGFAWLRLTCRMWKLNRMSRDLMWNQRCFNFSERIFFFPIHADKQTDSRCLIMFAICLCLKITIFISFTFISVNFYLFTLFFFFFKLSSCQIFSKLILKLQLLHISFSSLILVSWN